MFSIRKLSVAVVVGLMALSWGCQEMVNTAPESMNTTPLIVDDAMQLRDWQRSSACYSSGAVIAWPTGFAYRPQPQQPDWQYLATETPLFLGQTAALPVTLTLMPPWTLVVYRGATFPSTYTASPPLR